MITHKPCKPETNFSGKYFVRYPMRKYSTKPTMVCDGHGCDLKKSYQSCLFDRSEGYIYDNFAKHFIL